MIKDAQKEDRQEIYELWKMLYPDQKRNDLDFYVKNICNAANSIVAIQDNRIISTLVMREHAMMFAQRKLRVSFISGIATTPDYRRRGHMRELMNSALDEAEHNHLITFVEAFNPRIYERFGFEVVCSQKTYSIHRKFLHNVNVQGVSHTYTADDLMELYKSFTKHFDGWFIREREDFTLFIEHSKISHGNICVYRNQKNQLTGYAYYRKDGKEAHVFEIVYLESIALVKMLKYICDNYPEVSVEVSQSESIEKLFPMTIPKRRPCLMARLNHIELFNKLYNCDVYNIKDAYGLMKKPVWNNELY